MRRGAHASREHLESKNNKKGRVLVGQAMAEAETASARARSCSGGPGAHSLGAGRAACGLGLSVCSRGGVGEKEEEDTPPG
eukprot:7638845-Alexandrium_andersonii.AAC.1